MDKRTAISRAIDGAWTPVLTAMLDGRIPAKDAEAVFAALNRISDLTLCPATEGGFPEGVEVCRPSSGM